MRELDKSRLAAIALILCDSGPDRVPAELRRKKILTAKVEYQVRLPRLRRRPGQ